MRKALLVLHMLYKYWQALYTIKIKKGTAKMKPHICGQAALLTALLLSASFTLPSCQDSDVQKDTPNTSPAETAASTETAENLPQYENDNLPANLDFGGAAAHIFGWSGSSSNEFYVEEETGDIVNDAIFLRNRTAEERLNLKLTYTLEPGAYNERNAWVKMVTQSTMAGDGANDIVAGYSMCGATLAYNRLLLDLTKQEYIDFSKPWWPDSLIKEALCDGKLFFCSGDISTNMINYLYALYFNKTMAQSFDIDPTALYDMVRRGEWTLDQLITLSQGVYMDLNGNNQKDIEDRFGYTVQSVWSDTFFFASGLRTTEVGSDGMPIISPMFGSEKTQTLLEKLNSMFNDSNDMYFSNEAGAEVRRQFLEGRAMFITTEIVFANTHLRSSDIDYGILPVPKYDTEQADYYTVASFPYTLYGIPVDAKDPKMSAALLECLASESYRTVSPALFETALKVKYASDNDVSEMYDIIRNSAVFDIGRIFNDSMQGKTYSMFRSCLVNKNSNWISTYTKEEKALLKMFDRVITSITKEE